MASKMHVVLEDDIDGSAAIETLAFTVDGVSYEIDLNAEHAADFRSALAPWTTAARRVGGRRTVGRSSADLAAIRAWAREHGHQVADRGRIATEIRDAYYAAH